MHQKGKLRNKKNKKKEKIIPMRREALKWHTQLHLRIFDSPH